MDCIIANDEWILVTGATGFIGSKLVEVLLNFGFRNIRCLSRSSERAGWLRALANRWRDRAQVEILVGNLLSRRDCTFISDGAAVIYHLAAARGEKSFPDAYMNSVVTTRNLLDAALETSCLRRFVSVSSFAVYTNEGGDVLDESSPIEDNPALRGDAYCFAKSKQEAIVREYGIRFALPYVIVRPGHVYGPGNHAITGRVGINTFGIFLHLGGTNPVPLTYVDNCAKAVALAGLKKLERTQEVFNIVDDNLPSSATFLQEYKRNVKAFRSLYIPTFMSYILCSLWEKYSRWSEAQVEPLFNRKRWRATWKPTKYSNNKLKERLGWSPSVSTADGLRLYFESCRNEVGNA